MARLSRAKRKALREVREVSQESLSRMPTEPDPISPPPVPTETSAGESRVGFLRLALARVYKADSELHAFISSKFPRSLSVTDKVLGVIFDIVSHNAFNVIAGLVIVVLGIAGISKLVLISLACAWLISILWIARSKPVQRLTIVTRFLVVVCCGLALGFTARSFGGWAISSYKAQQENETKQSSKVPVIEPSYELQQFGLPIAIPASSRMYIVRLHTGRKIDLANVVNQELVPMQWPGKEHLYPPEAVGRLSFSNHGEVSVFNVSYKFSIAVGGEKDPGGVTVIPVGLPLFDIAVGETRVFSIVNQSADAAILRLSKEATLQVQGSSTRTTVRLQPRDLNFIDKYPLLSQSLHKWSGDKILPPFDTRKFETGETDKPQIRFSAIAIPEQHQLDDKVGGFKWDDPRFVDVRLQIMNSGAIAQNLVIQVRTSYIFWHVFEVGHFPGLSLRLIDYAGPGGAPGVAMKGVDKDGKEVFVQPSEIAYSSDAEIRCESLDGGEAVMVGFAVTPRDKSLRSLPTRLDLKGSYDYRSNTGLERLKIPVTPISVVANR